MHRNFPPVSTGTCRTPRAPRRVQSRQRGPSQPSNAIPEPHGGPARDVRATTTSSSVIRTPAARLYACGNGFLGATGVSITRPIRWCRPGRRALHYRLALPNELQRLVRGERGLAHSAVVHPHSPHLAVPALAAAVRPRAPPCAPDSSAREPPRFIVRAGPAPPPARSAPVARTRRGSFRRRPRGTGRGCGPHRRKLPRAPSVRS